MVGLSGGDGKRGTSTGLNLTDVIESSPQLNECSGSLRVCDHRLTTLPLVANKSSVDNQRINFRRRFSSGRQTQGHRQTDEHGRTRTMVVDSSEG